MRTGKDLIQFAGKSAVLQSNGFRFPVRILDSREQAGRLEHLVEPVSGEGKDWVPAWLINLTENGNGNKPKVEAETKAEAKPKVEAEKQVINPRPNHTHTHENDKKKK